MTNARANVPSAARALIAVRIPWEKERNISALITSAVAVNGKCFQCKNRVNLPLTLSARLGEYCSSGLFSPVEIPISSIFPFKRSLSTLLNGSEEGKFYTP